MVVVDLEKLMPEIVPECQDVWGTSVSVGPCIIGSPLVLPIAWPLAPLLRSPYSVLSYLAPR
jgi:hypothetical protein